LVALRHFATWTRIKTQPSAGPPTQRGNALVTGGQRKRCKAVQKGQKEKLGDVQTRGGVQAGLYFGDKKIQLLRGLAFQGPQELTRLPRKLPLKYE
jgi:hypothetical protein